MVDLVKKNLTLNMYLLKDTLKLKSQYGNVKLVIF